DACNRAAKLDPNSFYITKEYGLYLERLGQKPQATPLLKRAYAMNPQDEQLAQALRRLGIVPGPSLKDQSALAKPVLPPGPLPPVNEWGGSGEQARPAVNPAPRVAAPRD